MNRQRSHKSYWFGCRAAALAGLVVCQIGGLPALSASALGQEPGAAESGDETTLAGRQPGLSSTGGIGLPGMPTAAAGPPWQLRAGLWLRGFAQSDYLIAGDHDGQLVGGLHLDVTLGRYVEAYFLLGASSNQNDRPFLTGRVDPPLILTMGDLSGGLKIHGQVLRDLHIALRPFVNVSSSSGTIGDDTSTTSPGVDFLTTLDLKRALPYLPLRLHLQVGYVQDRSSNLLPGQGCSAPAGSSATVIDTAVECAHSRIVSTAAYGIHQPRFRLALGTDVAFPIGKLLALGPLVEYHMEAVTDSGDAVIANSPLKSGSSAGLLSGRTAQWLTAAARLHTAINLTFDIGFVAGLASPGYAMGSPIPQIAGYGGLTWANDFLSGRKRASAAPVTPPPAQAPVPQVAVVIPPPVIERVAPPPAPTEGKIRGVLRDAQTGQILPNVVLRFPGHRVNPLLTDERGEFETCNLPAGPLALDATRSDYQGRHVEVVVLAGQTLQIDLSMATVASRTVPPGVARIDVLNERGQPLPASLTLTQNGRRIDVPPDIAGGFMAQAPAGQWLLHIESEGYLSREQPVVLTPDGQRRLTVTLRRRPAVSAVRLAEDQIVLKGSINFSPGTAELTGADMVLLDEVVDLLMTHPDLRRIRIEGHTDNAGKAQFNQELSEQRAAAVRNYLVKQGVAADRLQPEGFGATQPLVPNLSPANRQKNRRIVFKVMERGPHAH